MLSTTDTGKNMKSKREKLESDKNAEILFFMYQFWSMFGPYMKPKVVTVLLIRQSPLVLLHWDNRYAQENCSIHLWNIILKVGGEKEIW